MAIYAALSGKDDFEALRIAANHDGDSDSTAAICGNLVRAGGAFSSLPVDYSARVEVADCIEDLLKEFDERPATSCKGDHK